MLRINDSIPDQSSLTEFLDDTYGLTLSDMSLYRSMIGAVYFLSEKDKRFVFKLYRAFDTKAAIQSTEIIEHLRVNNFPVVSIIPTRGNKLYSSVEMPEGNRVGVLFERIDGKDPDAKGDDIYQIGRVTGQMHRLMDNYDGEIRKLGRQHYVDRFVKIMRDLFSEKDKVDAMEEYGNELWGRLSALPRGFCHGDLHSGNLLKTKDGEIIFFDFDIASNTSPAVDVASICDETGFSTLDLRDIEKTHRTFERFYAGYSKERRLSLLEKSVIFDCIALRHYELNGTIPRYRLPFEGNHWLNDGYFNKHYTWMMQWKDAKKPVIS